MAGRSRGRPRRARGTHRFRRPLHWLPAPAFACTLPRVAPAAPISPGGSVNAAIIPSSPGRSHGRISPPGNRPRSAGVGPGDGAVQPRRGNNQTAFCYSDRAAGHAPCTVRKTLVTALIQEGTTMARKSFGYALMIGAVWAVAVGCSVGDPAQAQTSQAVRNEVREALGDVPIRVDTLTASSLSG